MREIDLIGAKHGIAVKTFIGWQSLEVSPPEELVTEIGKSSVVALEHSNAVLTDEQQFLYDILTKGASFFNELALRLHEKGVTVHDIDDPQLSQVTQPALLDRIRRLRNRDEQGHWLSERSLRSLGRSAATLNYNNVFARENAMFKNLATIPADIVIIGEDHANELFTNQAVQERLDVSIGRYRVVQPDEGQAQANPFSRTPVRSELITPTAEQIEMVRQKSAIERELTQRRYNAYKIGRVLGRKAPAPDFLGRFYITDLAEDSLFELSLRERDDNTFTGVIHDILGDASVTGTISEGHVEFMKEYDLTSVQPGNHRPLHYVGELDNTTGLFTGRWGAKENGKFAYGPIFHMREFDKGTLKALNQFGSSRIYR